MKKFFIMILGLSIGSLPLFGLGKDVSLGPSFGYSQSVLAQGGQVKPTGFGIFGLETTYLSAGDMAFFMDIAFGTPLTSDLGPIPSNGPRLSWQVSMGPGFRIPGEGNFTWVTAPCITIDSLNVTNQNVSLVSWGIQWFNQARWKLDHPAPGTLMAALFKPEDDLYLVLQARAWGCPFAFASAGLPNTWQESGSWGLGGALLFAIDF